MAISTLKQRLFMIFLRLPRFPNHLARHHFLKTNLRLIIWLALEAAVMDFVSQTKNKNIRYTPFMSLFIFFAILIKPFKGEANKIIFFYDFICNCILICHVLQTINDIQILKINFIFIAFYNVKPW